MTVCFYLLSAFGNSFFTNEWEQFRHRLLRPFNYIKWIAWEDKVTLAKSTMVLLRFCVCTVVLNGKILDKALSRQNQRHVIICRETCAAIIIIQQHSKV